MNSSAEYGSIESTVSVLDRMMSVKDPETGSPRHHLAADICIAMLKPCSVHCATTHTKREAQSSSISALNNTVLHDDRYRPADQNQIVHIAQHSVVLDGACGVRDEWGAADQVLKNRDEAADTAVHSCVTLLDCGECEDDIHLICGVKKRQSMSC